MDPGHMDLSDPSGKIPSDTTGDRSLTTTIPQAHKNMSEPNLKDIVGPFESAKKIKQREKV